MVEDMGIYGIRFPAVHLIKPTLLKIDGIDDNFLCAYSHSTSPIEPNSEIYDVGLYNIHMLKNQRINGKLVYLTLVELPVISVPTDSFKGDVLKFGAIIRNNAGVMIRQYAVLEMTKHGDCMKTKQCHRIVVNLASNPINYSMNTNDFVFFSDIVNEHKVSRTINIISYRRGTERKRKFATDEKEADAVFQKVLQQVSDLKNDTDFLLKISRNLEKYNEKKRIKLDSDSSPILQSKTVNENSQDNNILSSRTNTMEPAEDHNDQTINYISNDNNDHDADFSYLFMPQSNE